MTGRVLRDGKHLVLDGQPYRVRGATYGSFLPRLDGAPFPERNLIKMDLAAMAAAGLTVVRTYALPPSEVLDIAEDLGLRVLIGLHYDDWRVVSGSGRRTRRFVLDAGRRAVDEALEACAGRPGVLGISVGNEVPGDLVRLHGVGAVEDVLSALVAQVKAGDPHMLATYCSYPTTEYLRIEGMDLACFNVFLERPGDFRAYVRHLQVVAGDLPLVLAEVGLAAGQHGVDEQARSVAWQLGIADESGCAGAVVFSWTDEWGVAGQPVDGWGFGITDEDRRPKPALAVVSEWARSSPRRLGSTWPSVSVVVCAYNEERRIGECLASLRRLDYPRLEVLVCDDGSTDRTLELARRSPFRVLALPHKGLGAARNAGVAAASGEIVAFLDADAACHPEWLYHVALAFKEDGVAAVGGPNLPARDAGLVERAVARGPGNPVEVLLSDDRAEHVPGCNMAIRRDILTGIGGFDTSYTAAGDDVDVCWRLLDEGYAIAFAAAAQVRHHRRDTLRGYLRQQRGYGRAERAVAQRHPHRFNRLGQARWRGVLYGGLQVGSSLLRPVIYHGTMGLAPFQPIAHGRMEPLLGLIAPMLPVAAIAAVVGALLAVWRPGWLALPLAAGALMAAYAALVAASTRPQRDEPYPAAFRLLVAALHLAQPLARTWGRLARPDRVLASQSIRWAGERSTWLRDIEHGLRARRCSVRALGPHCRWDLSASVGVLLEYQIVTAVVWQWLPRHRRSLRPRSSLSLALALGLNVVLWLAGRPALAAGLVAGIVVAGLLELALLRPIVDDVLSTTSGGGVEE